MLVQFKAKLNTATQAQRQNTGSYRLQPVQVATTALLLTEQINWTSDSPHVTCKTVDELHRLHP